MQILSNRQQYKKIEEETIKKSVFGYCMSFLYIQYGLSEWSKCLSLL